jgi:hypothetical protein
LILLVGNSLFLLLLFLFGASDAMNFPHLIFEVEIVGGGDGLSRANEFHDFLVLIELGPLGGVEPAGITEIDIRAVGNKEDDYLAVSEPGRVVQRSEPALVLGHGAGARVEQQLHDAVVVLLDGVVKGHFLADIEVVVQVGVCAGLEQDLHDQRELALHCEVQRCEPVQVTGIHLGLLLLNQLDRFLHVRVGHCVEQQGVALELRQRYFIHIIIGLLLYY